LLDSTPFFYTFFMPEGNTKNGWERTNVTNLLRNEQSGRYYARVKVNGKQKWRTLKTTVFSVAKLRLADVEKQMRAQGRAAAAEDKPDGSSETAVSRFIAAYRTQTANDASLAAATKSRREIALKALEKTWPQLGERDVRRITPTECQDWAARALKQGTGFVAPKAKSVRAGMSASAFNKCVEALRGIFEIARERGMMYGNPAEAISRAKLKKKVLELPSAAQFHALAKHIAEAGARQSKDCADMVRLLAYSGVRLAEAVELRWNHIDEAKKQLRVPGTKSEKSVRWIPLFPALAALLDEIRARRGPESADAAILGVKECKGALASGCAALGIKRITHHDLRHLFATRCIESGVDIPTVSRWLGHADGGALAMRVYGHLRHEHSTAQAAKVRF
jgi:integrase